MYFKQFHMIKKFVEFAKLKSLKDLHVNTNNQ